MGDGDGVAGGVHDMSKAGRISAVLLSSRTLMVLALGAAAAAGVAFLGGGSSHQVIAEFTDAKGLVAGNEIRVAGLQSGSVDSVQIKLDGKGGQVAVAVLNVDDVHWPLHQGTSFAVRPKGVLSNVFVSLQPGPAGQPVIETGHTFTTKETSSPISLDEFSNLFNQDVRESIRTQIQEGVVAFGGAGADNTNALLQNLNPLSRDLSPVTAVLAQRSPELDRLNGEFDTITAELAREDTNLRGLIANGNTLLRTIATHAQSVQGTLVHAAGTLDSLDQALRGEEANLAQFFRKGPSSLDSAAYLADQTNPVLSYINPHVHDLDLLLGYFLSATGYDSGSHQLNSRIDATLYLGNNRTAIPCGGQQWAPGPESTRGPNNTGDCANTKPLPAPDAGATQSSSSTGSAPSTPATDSASTSHTKTVAQLFGGLFQ
jgi:phospholipid/cholesterol/gamma-HCH transport system substrate-binding protein